MTFVIVCKMSRRDNEGNKKMLLSAFSHHHSCMMLCFKKPGVYFHFNFTNRCHRDFAAAKQSLFFNRDWFFWLTIACEIPLVWHPISISKKLLVFNTAILLSCKINESGFVIQIIYPLSNWLFYSFSQLNCFYSSSFKHFFLLQF